MATIPLLDQSNVFTGSNPTDSNPAKESNVRSGLTTPVPTSFDQNAGKTPGLKNKTIIQFTSEKTPTTESPAEAGVEEVEGPSIFDLLTDLDIAVMCGIAFLATAGLISLFFGLKGVLILVALIMLFTIAMSRP